MSPALQLAQERYRYKLKCRRLSRKTFQHIVSAPKSVTLEEIVRELIQAEAVFNKALGGFQ